MATSAPKKTKGSSERTYGQRYTKGVALYDLIKDEATYDPQNNERITKVGLKLFLDKFGKANKDVADLTEPYNTAQDDRVTMYHGVEGLIQRSVMVRNVLGGYPKGKQTTAFLRVQELVQEMRNYRKPKERDEADGTEPEASSPSQSQTSFGSLLQKGWEVLAVMKNLPAGYKTNNPLVTLAAYEAYMEQLVAQNTVVTDALKPLNEAIRERNKLVEGEDGLTARVRELKSYVAGEMQEGKKSNLHKDLMKVRYE